MLVALRARNDVGYFVTDKNLGPALYDREIYLQHCRTHLFDVRNYRFISADATGDYAPRVFLRS
eukprot:2920580-Rhodomonas_salina.1